MNRQNNISMAVIRRLPKYYRYLSDLSDAGVTRISSKELARKMGLTASQIRQDLNCFGGFGQQGYGYDVANLYSAIGEILGVDNSYPAVIVGCGNLGKAIALFVQSSQGPFKLLAGFDVAPSLVGHSLNTIPILHSSEISSFCEHNEVKAAFLCLPTESAKLVVARLYEKGVRYFCNFTHYNIKVKYKDAVVENVHITDSLLTLCYSMNSRHTQLDATEQ